MISGAELRRSTRGGRSASSALGGAVLCAALALVAAGPTASQPSPVVDAWATVDSFAVRSLASQHLPGMSLAVTDRDGVVYERYVGWADLKTGRPVDETTLFQIGSVTKSLTALSLLRLMDQGRFDPQRPVTDYLPWFSVHSEFEPIRVHHLLTHSAGIPANRDDMHGSPFQARALRDRHTAWPPGERYLYSNVGYQVLHVLLERLDGRPYDRILAESILEPAGMSNAESVITLESRPRQAIGYVPPFDDRPHHASRGVIEAPFFPYDIGDGSVQATARDLAAYARLWLNRGVGPGGRVVAESSFRLFSTGHVQDGSGRYGYGVRMATVDGHEVMTHSGGMVGFTTHLYADTTAGIAAVVMVNGPGSGSSVARYALSVARSISEGSPIPGMPATRPDPGPEALAEYRGTFRGADGSVLVFDVADVSLRVSDGSDTGLLSARGRDVFYTPDAPFDHYFLAFERNEADSIIAVTHGPRRFVGAGAPIRDLPETPGSWLPVVGKYRSWSPWLPWFEVFVREGRLILVTGEGGESSSGETELHEIGPGVFRIGDAPTPERLSFHEELEGHALTADWSGHVFFRVNR